MLGKSIFMEFHEQGMGHKIGGFYTAHPITDEDLQQRLLNIIGQPEFGERDGMIIIDHRKLQAMRVLEQEIDKKVTYVLEKFFPEALVDIDSTERFDTFGFVHYNSKANEFININRNHEMLMDHMYVDIRRRADLYRQERPPYRERK